MPLPPAHALSVFFLYFKGKRFIDPLALLMSATFVDLEPLYYILIGNSLDHQIWHGYLLLLTIYPLLITLAACIIERLLDGRLLSAYNALGLKPIKARYSLLIVYASCLVGSLSHIFFDMFTHETLPFVIYPFSVGSNPFYLAGFSGLVEGVVVVLALYSIFCWVNSAKSQRVIH
jgi:hypothetical protein